MVRFCILYAGDDLEAEREIIKDITVIIILLVVLFIIKIPFCKINCGRLFYIRVPIQPLNIWVLQG